MNFKRILFSFQILIGAVSVYCQQSHSMFFMHYLPESNLLNPAVPITCKWYIGLPALSSIHFNYANSSMSYNQLVTPTSTGTSEIDITGTINRLHWRNYIGTELHIQLFALGYKWEHYSFMFTITEKNNIPVTYPKKPISLLWDGNTQFEGEKAGFKGTGIYFNHYREYALSVSKRDREGIYYGIRAKLLFGKLNLSTISSDVGIFTDETSFALEFNGNVEIRSSLPIVIDYTEDQINSISYNDNIGIRELVLNRKNPGLAFDAGIIYPYTDQIKLSASVLDLGFIWWKSNQNTFKGSGNFDYDGPLGDSLIDENYITNLLDSFTDSLDFEIAQENYINFLPPRFTGGATYDINKFLTAGIQASAIIHRSKVISSLTLSGQFEPLRNIHLILSYPLQYYSFNNIGLGMVLGRNPVQFYIISDNALGLIKPLSARNLNLRFGLNINFGCKFKEKDDSKGKGMVEGNCYWIEQGVKRYLSKTVKNKKRRLR